MGMLDDFIAGLSGPQASSSDIAGMTPQQRAPLTDNAIGGALSAFGTFAGGVSHVMFGLQAQQAAAFQAAQLRQNAGQAEAGSERQAFDAERQTQFITSRALAVAAASGGGASDPTVVSMMARDAGQGAYEQAVALYQGQDRARVMQEQAQAKDYEGRSTLDNSLGVGGAQFALGASNLLQAQSRGASLFRKFGGGGPPGGWGADATGGGY